MAKFLTLKVVHSGCRRKPRPYYPANVVISLDPANRKVKTWLIQKSIELVPDDTPLTDTKEIRRKMAGLLKR